ncbi:MAG: recombinase family protein [Aristaeellaceae bacterium]
MKSSIQGTNGHSTTGRLRVAAYCRVSTELEEQEGSFETQMRYYREKIEWAPDMELVGIYGDKGKSGLKASSRPELQRLLRDCKAGKVDLILTKSISRFARSMADCVELIRRLRTWQVTVYFEKEGLRTDDSKSDLVIGILAALAQEESHSISQNSIRSHEQCASTGRPSSRAAYGYTRTEDGTWQVDPEEAQRVRTAFRMAAEGHSYAEILTELNAMEQQKGTGIIWLQKRLHRLLRNVVYQGDYYSHSTVCLTPGHQVVNRGYRDRFYIEEHHEPLVSRAMFERVQQMMDGGFLLSYMPMTEEKRRAMQDESWKLDA